MASRRFMVLSFDACGLVKLVGDPPGGFLPRLDAGIDVEAPDRP